MIPKQYSVPLSFSIALHVVILAVLIAGNFTSAPVPTPQASSDVKPIEAVAVDKSQLEARVKQLQKAKSDAKAAEQKRLRELEERAAAAKKKRAQEQERIKKLERERKKKEAEKRKADDAAKKARDKAAKAEKVRKQKEAERQKAEKAALEAKARKLKEEAAAKKAEEIRKQKEIERKRIAEEKAQKAREEQERKLQEQMLAEQMAAEMAERNKAKSAQIQSEVAKYTGLISQTINRKVNKDRSTMEGKFCVLNITLGPSSTGKSLVINVQVKSGDPIVCKAATSGVYQARELPMSKDPDVYKTFKNFNLRFVPEFND